MFDRTGGSGPSTATWPGERTRLYRSMRKGTYKYAFVPVVTPDDRRRPEFSGALLSAVIVQDTRRRAGAQRQPTPGPSWPRPASQSLRRLGRACRAARRRESVQDHPGTEEPRAPRQDDRDRPAGPRAAARPARDDLPGTEPPWGCSPQCWATPTPLRSHNGPRYFIAAASSDADDTADERAAAAARNGDVVADISALLVSSLLGEFEYTRGQFRTLLTPTACRNDITAGRIRMDGWSASSGSVSYDPGRDTAVPRRLDIDGHLAALERFSKLEQALPRTHPTSAPPLSLLGEPAIEGAEAWLAPVALAKERGLCLWSDDAAQRNLARACGVRAFGTITLQQLRAVERLSAEDADHAACAAALVARHSEVMKALSERVVDVPAYAEGLIEQARREGWNDPGLAAATVGRPVWWTLSPAPWGDLQAVLAAAREDSGPATAWQEMALWGVSALAPDDPASTAALIACVCLIETSLRARIDHAVAMLRAGSAVATRRKASSLRLPGPSGNRTGCRWCPNRPAGLRHPDTRPPEPGPRRSFGQYARLTAPGRHSLRLTKKQSRQFARFTRRNMYGAFAGLSCHHLAR